MTAQTAQITVRTNDGRNIGDNALTNFNGKVELERISKFRKDLVRSWDDACEMAVLYVLYAMTKEAQGNADYLTRLYHATPDGSKERTKLAQWTAACSPFYLAKDKRKDEKTGEVVDLVRFKRNKKSPWLHEVNAEVLSVPFTKYKAETKKALFDFAGRLKAASNKVSNDLEKDDLSPHDKLYLETVAKRYQAKVDEVVKEMLAEVGSRKEFEQAAIKGELTKAEPTDDLAKMQAEAEGN